MDKERKQGMLDIHLYLGAHKTATTHLQGILLANRERLLTEGVYLSAPQDVRREWLPKFFRYCNAATEQERGKLARHLASVAPERGLWILTEENIIGVSNELTARPGIYPAAGERLRRLVELFPNANLRLFFSLRSYDGFYRSAYSEIVRNRGYLPFEAFFDDQRFQGNSWVETVRQFQEALPHEQIVLWKYEDFRALIPQLVQLLCDRAEVQELIDAYRPVTTRPSLSQKTMDILHDLHRVLDRQETLALVERINRAYPTGDVNPEYRPFAPDQEARLKDQYERDIGTIRQSFPAIRILKP